MGRFRGAVKLKDALIVVALVCLAVVPVAVSYYPGLYTTWWVDGGTVFSNGATEAVSGQNLVIVVDGGAVIIGGDAGLNVYKGTLTVGGDLEGPYQGPLLISPGAVSGADIIFGNGGGSGYNALGYIDTLGNLKMDGGVSVQGHIDFTGPKPTIATSHLLTGCFDAGAPTLSANSTDSAGVISLTTGSLAAGGCAGTTDIGDITFTGALSATRVACVVTPDITNTGAGTTIGILPTVALQSYGFSIFTSGIAQTPAPSTTYSWDYACFALH
jgi:hypothetical protein